MDVILLGNGYDLNLKLPTKYIDFLNTAKYLINNKDHKYNTIGEIFSNEFFDENSSIRNSFNAYQEIYNHTEIKQEDISAIISCLDGNAWFSYFLSSFNVELGWIDFEKEIRTVVESFQKLFEKDAIQIKCAGEITKSDYYIYRKFGIISVDPEASIFQAGAIKTELTMEYPPKSGNKILNKNKISDMLFSSLRELSDALALYMNCFVDAITQNLDKEKLDFKTYCAGIAISLNYTHTYELLNDIVGEGPYNPSIGLNIPSVYHVHGESGKKIVLGINPDKTDSYENADPIFAPFKKFFQRVHYNTDNSYIEFLTTVYEKNIKYNLYVMGHSLDITDKDTISVLFEAACSICVFYHSETAMASMIKNIISLFGIDTFNNLRTKKKLTFVNIKDKDQITIERMSRSMALID